MMGVLVSISAPLGCGGRFTTHTEPSQLLFDNCGHLFRASDAFSLPRHRPGEERRLVVDLATLVEIVLGCAVRGISVAES